MKKTLVIAALAASTMASAEVQALKGSDTLSGVLTDAIAGAGMQDQLSYAGGGSGLGEKAIVAKEQGIAPMSRPFSAAKLAEAQAAGITPVGHVIGLDGIGVFVNSNNATPAVNLPLLKKIYSCEVVKWQEIAGSVRFGEIKAYRRPDESGTTDAFKSLIGLTAFGPCVTVAAETADIARLTSTDANAIGYAGMSGHVQGNRPLAVSKTADSAPIMPSVDTIRAKTYPLGRELFLFEASGSFLPNDVEKALLGGYLLDRAFLDPILEAHEFYTID